MKYQTTRKAIVNGCNNVKSCGYCELAHLLRGQEASAYTSGVYGWNFDVYHIHGLTICTGYRGIPGERLKGCTEYEQKARAIAEDYNRPYEERQKEIAELLKEFCKMNGGVIYE